MHTRVNYHNMYAGSYALLFSITFMGSSTSEGNIVQRPLPMKIEKIHSGCTFVPYFDGIKDVILFLRA
jgi:hypothetical protein